ncbi:MAG: glycine--tRNA ligase subunit beta [Chromatiales bacterium]|jgi:glycyl-tRNA synthetase beta chain
MSDKADLLFELGTEELPPTALARLSQALSDEFIAGLQAAKLGFTSVQKIATPRRLGLLIRDCELQQPDQQIEKRGPAVQAAFDADGQPTRAASGFAQSCGVSVDQLERMKTDKGEWLLYRINEAGKSSAELLPEIAASALDKLPIPKRMHWGDSDAMFVRPVHWLLFLHGNAVVPCSILDASSSNLSFGHRFHHPGSIEINTPAEYFDKLEQQGKVIANFDSRRQKITEQVKQTAAELDGAAELDDELLDEVTALVEWPVPIAGSFETEFLEVPHEALILTMKKNQKYFPVFDKNHQLLNRFITIANIESQQPEVIREGNERVIRPRLADAKFFWDQDGKHRLESHQRSLQHIIFQKELGSIADKSARVAELAGFLADRIGGDRQLTERAGLLSRCDLVTEMVFEFPEMQGIMGRYQALRDKEPDELAQAMDEIYMPRFSGDLLPQSKTGICLALADRLDTLVGIFGIGQKPSGTKDPFALRRATLGIIRILREHSLTLNIPELLQQSYQLLADRITSPDTLSEVSTYINERLKTVLHEEGTPVSLINAVARVAYDNLIDFDARIKAVEEFSKLEQAEALAAANKRIQNILKKNGQAIPDAVDPSLFDSGQETSLFNAVQNKQQQITPLIAAHDYQAILLSLAELREDIDAFFDHVMVMTDVENVRLNRLALLQKLGQMFLEVADVSVLQES